MTNDEAIVTLLANYPDAFYVQFRTAVNMAIKALKVQDIAEDSISRQALKNALINWQMEYAEKDKDVERFDTLGKVIDLVEQMPTAEPKKGKWIKNEDRCGWHCSECMMDNNFAYDWDSETGEYEFQDYYCPHCGVKMEEKNNE